MKSKPARPQLSRDGLVRTVKTAAAAALMVLAYSRRGFGEFFVFAFSLAVHEGFHLISAVFLNIKTGWPVLGPLGLRFTAAENISGSRGALLYLSGPLGNLLFALGAALAAPHLYIYKSDFFIFYNLLIAAVNMLPAYPLDAARALTALLAVKKSRFCAVRTVCYISELVALMLFLLGLYIFIFRSNNLLLMLLAAMILGSARLEKDAAAADIIIRTARAAAVKKAGA